MQSTHQITQADHPKAVWTRTDLPDCQGLGKLAIRGPTACKQILVNDRKISCARRGKQRSLEHDPKEREGILHRERLRRATTCHCASADNAPAPHRMTSTGARAIAAPSVLARSRATATAALTRPSS